MFKETELVSRSKQYVEGVLKNLPDEYCYHNLQHTREVAAAAEEIGTQSKLSQEQLELVVLAAWFHDIGYKCGFDNHEEESIRLMRETLTEWKVPSEKIDNIEKIVLSTKMPQSPDDELSKVMCDADLYHLSSNDFSVRSEALRQELVTLCNKDISSKDWVKNNIEFLNHHRYFTGYGKQVLEPKKRENLEKLKKKENKQIDARYVQKLEEQVAKLKKKIEKDKVMKPDRGIETMFRITSKNHLTLSGMADNKANIMISINSIILSVLVSVLFRKFEDYPNLIIPGMLLVIVCLTTIVFAVLATRPNISSGTFTREDILERKTNLLFFGNFHNMELDNYMWGMKEMMKDADFLYGSMIKDIYFLGIVLGKKYRMLRKSYNVFMYGFIVSILAFVIAMVFFPA
ncbi:Metal-dependent phosphohydrolase [Fulvivirga imtechensis AK7]|uniref:Metal-dependent phosphohydrolase n=1 Tax=Fulvivirga imtechensis AK7 TaxID=1237149 RepID=L8JR40_9BACT|nr:Pycsar system effector family protein [Fulvivirga imtechensis]ELR69964.1 Metal-dependent phosphohydrolase [Fulvivirga imtechensis AK7]